MPSADAQVVPGADAQVMPGVDAQVVPGVDAQVVPRDAAASEPDANTDLPPSEPEYAALFRSDVLPSFHITLEQAAIDALTLDPGTYQKATLEYAGQIYEGVGVRLKGRASFQGFAGKPALKIKLNEFKKGQDLLGLKRLTLNNLTQDPSMSHEVLGYRLLRAAGVPAPRCNQARVYINDTYYGLYANVQSVDDVFVEEAYPDSKTGNLFDITNDEYFIDLVRETMPPAQETKFELETNKSKADISDLTALIDAVSTTPDEQFVSEVEKVLNLDQVLTLGATQAIMADWDGYFGARNNYLLYHELKGDRFVILPWGIDQTFRYHDVEYAIDHSSSQRQRSIIYERCAIDAGCLARYQDKVRTVLATFEALPLEAELDALLAQSADAIAEDTRKPYSAEQHENAVKELRLFLRERAAQVHAQLP